MSVDTSGEIYFYNGTEDGSFPWMDASPKLGWTASNYLRVPVRLPIYDLRGKENELDLDKNAFEVLKYTGEIHRSFADHSEEEKRYYEEIANVLKDRLGASRVLVFKHVIRYRGPPLTANQCDQTHKNPVFYPHIDSDPGAARLKVIEIVGEEEGQRLMKNRFQIINVWKPLGANPIVHTPLAICDCRSIDMKNDVHLSEVRGSDNTTSIYIISRNIADAQKWFYLSEMRSNEMFVFKIFDSNPNVAQYAAHTAFHNDKAPSTIAEQCSVEMRCLVFYDQ